jgi:hypothetical protein
MLARLRASAPEQRFAMEGLLHRALSTTLLHERFDMNR